MNLRRVGGGIRNRLARGQLIFVTGAAKVFVTNRRLRWSDRLRIQPAAHCLASASPHAAHLRMPGRLRCSRNCASGQGEGTEHCGFSQPRLWPRNFLGLACRARHVIKEFRFSLAFLDVLWSRLGGGGREGPHRVRLRLNGWRGAHGRLVVTEQFRLRGTWSWQRRWRLWNRGSGASCPRL